MPFDLYSSGLVRFGPFFTTAASITGPVITSAPTGSVLVQLGGSKPNNIRYRGVQLTFGSNADNATGNFALWARQNLVGSGGSELSGGPVISLGTGTFTSGNIVFPSSSGDFLADTITFTPSTFLSGLMSTLGAATPFVWSPADNTPALLRIEDLGNYDIYVDVWRNSATDVEVYVETNT